MGADADRLVVAWEKWRTAEDQYLEAIARFRVGEGDPPEMTKDDLVGLVKKRQRADRWRERYFKRQSG